MQRTLRICFRPLILIVLLLGLPSHSSVILVDGADIKVRDAGTNAEARGREPAVTVHPDDWKTVFMSLMSDSLDSCGEWISTDGGISWSGDGVGLTNSIYGDPSVVILKGSPATYFIQGTTKGFDQRAVYSNSPSSAFTMESLIDASGSTDKGWLVADNYSATRNLYSLWYQVNGVGLFFRYSSNGGGTWIPVQAYPLRSPGYCWGGTLCVAIAPSTSPPVLGHVYAAWPIASSFQSPPHDMRFKRSSEPPNFVPLGDGISVTSYPGGAFDPNAPLPGSDNTGANSIPSIAADDQGNIYIAWCQERRPDDGAAGDDAQVYISKSTFPSQGDAWSTPQPITTSTANQWHPSIAWDDEAKALVAMFHDSRVNANSIEVYLAVSYDRGASFAELKVSDVSWPGDVFLGDYHGLATGGGVAHPVWCDDRAGVRKAYTSPVLIGGIETTSIVPTITHFCTSSGSPRIRFQADWSTLAFMDGIDKLTVTRPGGTQASTTAMSTAKTHQLVLDNLPCFNGTYTYQIESNKGGFKSQSAVISISVTCMTCPPCPPPCDLE